MLGSVKEAFLFLIKSVFDLYLLILALRLILAWSKANYFNPITQVIIKATQFIITPLRNLIPNIGRFETATFIVIIALETIKFFLLYLLLSNIKHNLLLLGVVSIISVFTLCLRIWFVAIIIQVILSFISMLAGYQRIPFYIIEFLNKLTDPILLPLRRILPAINGFDFSPLPALIIIQFLLILFP